jgi:hypothetical protein
MTITERGFSLPNPYQTAAASARRSTLRSLSRFPVVGRTTGTNEPIVGHLNHGEWAILQDGRVACPAGTPILAGRLILSAPAMDFGLVRVRDGVLYSLVRGLLEAASTASERLSRAEEPSPLPQETPAAPADVRLQEPNADAASARASRNPPQARAMPPRLLAST